MHALRLTTLVPMLSLAALVACGGGGGGDTPPGGTHTLSGTITNGAEVTVHLSGARTGSTTTDADGHYAFHDLAPGSYTVTPDGTIPFAPTHLDRQVSGDVSGVDFALDLSGEMIVLFPSAPHNGNLGGRAGADALCASA